MDSCHRHEGAVVVYLDDGCPVCLELNQKDELLNEKESEIKDLNVENDKLMADIDELIQQKESK